MQITIEQPAAQQTVMEVQTMERYEDFENELTSVIMPDAVQEEMFLTNITMNT